MLYILYSLLSIPSVFEWEGGDQGQKRCGWNEHRSSNKEFDRANTKAQRER